MIRINVKPMSINEAFKGRRYKTKTYTEYEKKLLLILPKVVIPSGRIKLTLVFGITKVADIDNPTKALLDIFQKKYGFDDKNIYELHIKKVPVKTGFEFFEYYFEPC